MFLAAALLPLAVSDWISTSVIGGIGQQLTHDRGRVAARAAARQVFDRLMVSRAWLRAIDESRSAARVRLVAEATGSGGPFAALACADGDAESYARLRVTWEGARTGSTTSSEGTPSVALRLSGQAAGHDGLLMALARVQPPPCIALLNPDFAWKALHDAADDSAWTVRSDDGSTIFSWKGEDVPQVGDDRLSRFDRFTTHLFLASEFGAGSWTIEQRSPRPAVDWHGIPVVAWLLSVAAATLLLIGLAAHRTIRRTLRPLEVLTEGSRRIAAGIAPTRVDVRRNDELGRLAISFNEMATQLEDRIASLRALAQIDAGILGGAEFHQLAGGILARLVALQPHTHALVVWRDESGKFLAMGHSGAQPTSNDERVDSLEPAGRHVQAFERQEDGLFAASRLGELGIDAPCFATCAPEARCILLGVRDGDANQAMIFAELGDTGIDAQSVRDLRDRLTVALVARNRKHELEQRASRDQLTGLRNRYGLQLVIEPLVAGNDPFAVLFIDLDHFKDVNDCHGHAVGDRLLQAAAQRLQSSAPPDALLSRNGGDEFILVLPRSDSDSASAVGMVILEALRQPFGIASTEHRCSASIGIAMYPEHGSSREDLVRCADIALYESKNKGRDRITMFRPAFDAKVRERNKLLSSLDRALRRSEFVVHYQPRMDARTGAIIAAEALVRWQHPERGLIMPGVFIDLAESSGMIDALGLFVMDAAIAQIHEWQRAGMPLERVSVNVSQHQFASGNLVAHVKGMLLRHGVPGSRLEIEVTESVLGDDIANVRRQLHELRAMGIAIAMDDFGTGYSSLSQLRTLPIDVMKIDRAFVKDLETHPDAVAVARTIVTLARALGLKIVAEGIETPAQATLLQTMGCDQFQGFLYSEAVPAFEFSALASKDRALSE